MTSADNQIRFALGTAKHERLGFPKRHWFEHEVIVVPKTYPDGLRHMIERFPRLRWKRGQFFQLNLYAIEVDDLPDILFFDQSVNWHGQHMGKKGLIAAAGLYIAEQHCFITTLQSDVCQQLYRHWELRAMFKTRFDKHYGYWYRILVNAVLNYCAQIDVKVLYCPTAETIVSHRAKFSFPGLFARIYDDPPKWLDCTLQRTSVSSVWRIPLASNVERLVNLMPARRQSTSHQCICIFHDIEGAVDTAVSPDDCDRFVEEMLDLEKAAGVKATYSVLGTLWTQLQGKLQRRGVDSFAFHSFDHSLNRLDQLERVRGLDLQVKGYRPPQSRLTAELTDLNLTYYNFEWLLSSATSLRCESPLIGNGIVKIPVHIDDYPLHTGLVDWDTWLGQIHRLLAGSLPTVVIGLHDCYASKWIDRYGELLSLCGRNREPRSCDQISREQFLSSSEFIAYT